MKQIQLSIWNWIYNNSISLFLASLFLTTLVFVSFLSYQKYYLFVAQPLENLVVDLDHQPIVLGEDKIFDFRGTFDRDVVCEIVSFRLYLTNQKTNDIFVLDKRHLVKVPPTNRKPGEDLPIHFALLVPEHFTAGNWSSEFVGTYYCRKSIFGHLKTQSVQGPSFSAVNWTP